MDPQVAAIIFTLGIGGLFALDAALRGRTSKAVWIPVLWIAIAGSRPVSSWLGVAPEAGDEYVDGSPFDRNIYLFLLIAGCFCVAAGWRKAGAVLRGHKTLIVFLAYCALSVLWSDFPDVAFKRWVKAIGDVVMVLLIATDLEPITAMRRTFARTAFFLLPLSVMLIKFFPETGRIGRFDADRDFSFTGVTNDKNMLGMISLILGLGSAWRFFHELSGANGKRSIGALLVHGSVMTMALWLIRTADSSTSLACFGMGCIVLAVTNLFPIRRTMLLHLLTAGLIFGAVYAVFLRPEAGLTEAVGRNSTLTGRRILWEQLQAMVEDPIFGVGYESFWLGDRLAHMRQVWTWFPSQAHNGYLEVYLDLGIVGLSLLGAMLIGTYRRIIQAFHWDWHVASLGLAYFVVVIVYNFTEHAFREMHPVWISLLFASLTIPELARRSAEDSVEDEEEPVEELPLRSYSR